MTNFDITRYDVERIMESSTLLSGEQARRNKEVETGHNGAGKTIFNSNLGNNGDESGWKMTLHQNPPPMRSSFPTATLHDMVGMGMGMEPVNLVRPSEEDHLSLTKLGGAHFSNPSSLVTSLSSSREASPDRNGSGSGSKFAAPPPVVSSWFSMSHLPVFAAWGDT